MCIRTWGRKGAGRLLCNHFNSRKHLLNLSNSSAFIQLFISLLVFAADPEKRALWTPSSGLLKNSIFFVFLSTLSEHSHLSHTTSFTLIQLSSNSQPTLHRSIKYFFVKNAKKHEKWRFFGPSCKPLFFVHFSKTAKFCSGVHRAFWPKNAFFSLFCLTPKNTKKTRFLTFFDVFCVFLGFLQILVGSCKIFFQELSRCLYKREM